MKKDKMKCCKYQVLEYRQRDQMSDRLYFCNTCGKGFFNVKDHIVNKKGEKNYYYNFGNYDLLPDYIKSDAVEIEYHLCLLEYEERAFLSVRDFFNERY